MGGCHFDFAQYKPLTKLRNLIRLVQQNYHLISIIGVPIKKCNSCGKCCIKYSNGQLSASQDEIEYWEVFKPEIAEYVSNGKIWSEPSTGKLIELCPWLRKAPASNTYSCAIYFDRPEDCRIYPSTIAEMIRDECEMLDGSDIDNPNKAQHELDIIMADSR